MSFDSSLVQRLFGEDAAKLEAIPSMEKIKDAGQACEPSKAPGYDGVHLNFI